MALGSHAGHADSIVTKKFRSQHTLLISHKAKAHHLHTQHQIAAKAPALIEHHPHAKAATAAGLANKKVLAKIAVPKEHSTSPLHKAEASPAKTDSAKLMKAAATKQHSTFPLHKDGRAIQAPVKWEGFNPRHASEILETYLEQHPAVASEAMSWVIVGVFFLIVATSLLLFSEIRAVLVTRERDFRQQMIAGNYMYPTETLKELQVVEDKVMSERPYLTFFSTIILFVSMVCVLKPFCNVLDIIGLPSSSCFLTVSFSAFVAAVTTSCLLMGLCWSCTRGVAACVLLGIGLAGDVLCPTGSPVLVVMWLLFAGAVYFLYFIYLPQQEEVPVWCQSIGPMKPSMDPHEWRRTLAPVPSPAAAAAAAAAASSAAAADPLLSSSTGGMPTYSSVGCGAGGERARRSCTV